VPVEITAEVKPDEEVPAEVVVEAPVVVDGEPVNEEPAEDLEALPVDEATAIVDSSDDTVIDPPVEGGEATTTDIPIEETAVIDAQDDLVETVEGAAENITSTVVDQIVDPLANATLPVEDVNVTLPIDVNATIPVVLTLEEQFMNLQNETEELRNKYD